MNEVEACMKKGCVWKTLPEQIKSALGHSKEEYDRMLFKYSIRNQLRFKRSAVRFVYKDERAYYVKLINHSQRHLMLYPYHLQEKMIGLRITPFSYYLTMMEEIMTDFKSYDSLPNFTAADCLRLLGIGRNQFIDLMNQCRLNRKFNLMSMKRIVNIREYLPHVPVQIPIQPWWIVCVGFVTEEDIKGCSPRMQSLIDSLIDCGPQIASSISINLIHSLYSRGLIYLHIPIEDSTRVYVPPLEGFVMNRVLGDYLETLLYKIFISIDERTTVAELALVLDTSKSLVKRAVALFCRLGFAQVLTSNEPSTLKMHYTWREKLLQESSQNKHSKTSDSGSDNISIPHKSDASKFSGTTIEADTLSMDSLGMDDLSDAFSQTSLPAPTSPTHKPCREGKRIMFLYDSSLTAFLMMGNLSTGLKNHAVTLYEVGKLTDESMDHFVHELDAIKTMPGWEGEARRYQQHALVLRSTILALRQNKRLTELLSDDYDTDAGIGLDLVRSESLTSLDRPTMNRLLNKNYHVAISMSPLNEVGVISDSDTFHMIGPTSPIVASVWMKLYIYELVGSGPISMLFPIQSNLQSIPEVFQQYDELLVQSFTHEPVVARTSNVMFMIHEILQNSPVLIQGYRKKNFTSSKTFIPFNHPSDTMDGGDADKSSIAAKLHEKLGLQHTCGYLTLLNTAAAPKNGTTTEATEHDPPCLLDINFGIPLFEESLNHEVCEGIVNSDICGKESLLSLTKFNEGLVKDVVAFVQAQNQWRDPSVHPKQTITKHKSKVPFPMSTLIFQNGKVTSWKP